MAWTASLTALEQRNRRGPSYFPMKNSGSK